MHELLGKVYKPLGNQKSLPAGALIAALVVCSWGYLIYTGNISTIWPLFGTGNQLLATIALAVVTVFLVNMGKTKYAWLTAIPMAFVGTTTVTAGILSIQRIFWPLTHVPGKQFQGYLDSTLMAIFIVGVVLVLGDAAVRVWKTLHGEPIPQEAFGVEVQPDAVKMRCC
jgi:carbon starvation protein